MTAVVSSRAIFNSLSKHPERYFSSLSPHNKLLWIQGGNSYIAQSVRIAAIQEQWTVISTQKLRKGQLDKLEQLEVERVKFINLGDNDIYDPAKIGSLMEKNIDASFKGNIVFFNAVGGAHVPKGSDLEKLNKGSALCFAESINLFLSNRKEEVQSTFIHCSSVAAALVADEGYGLIKKETDETLLRKDSYHNIDRIFCFRIGYVVQSLLKGGLLKETHAFGPEQIAKFSPIQPVIINNGHEATIYPVHVQDIVRATLNASSFCPGDKRRIRETVDVVGPSGYSQSKFFEFYTDIFKRRFIPLPIKIEDFETIATHFPYGHLAKYAADYVRIKDPKLDETLFKELVGRELTPLGAIKSEIDDSRSLNSSKDNPNVPNPFFRYTGVVFKNIVKNGRASYRPALTLLSISSDGIKKYLRVRLRLEK